MKTIVRGLNGISNQNSASPPLLKRRRRLKTAAAFGQVLRHLRLERQISQEKLALMSGLDRTFISLLERGLRQPTLKTIIQLSRSLAVSPSKMIAEVEAILNENSEI